jgi:hypothetical protein
VSEPSAADAAFFEQTFADALAVVEEARDSIVSGVARGEGMTLEPAQKMRLSQELSRLTSRATGAMSLLLMYKAIVTGQAAEIDNIPTRLEELYASVQASSAASLDPALADVALPDAVESLRQRAEGVFERMDRLYQMIAVQIAN